MTRTMSAKAFEPFSLDPDHLAGKRITVMGLGRFGGGAGAARFFAARGAEVTVTDSAQPETLEQSVRSLESLPNICFRLGGHIEEDFTSAEAIVVNPAVPLDSPYLTLAKKKQVPLTAEMNIFLRLCRGKVVGVTGSNGKSTTTAMIGNILSIAAEAHQGSFRKVFVGGNIGHCLLPELDEITAEDIVVVELSSFQLEALAVERISPHIAVWTNLTPNHLDRHKSMDAYRKAKENIYLNQGPQDVLIYPADDRGSEFLRTSPTVRSRRVSFSLTSIRAEAHLAGDYLYVRYSNAERDRKVLHRKNMPVPGQHNVANALAAACVGAQFGLAPELIGSGLRTFKPLPHRLELLATINGVSYYDDSIATTPESALVGLNSFDSPPIIILGGKDKGVSFQNLLTCCNERAYAIICLGEVREKLLSELLQLRSGASEPYVQGVGSLEQAVKVAADLAKPGQAVLLSPGCASYDMFNNFDHRGREFALFVRALESGRARE